MDTNKNEKPANTQIMFQDALHLHRKGMIKDAMQIYRQIIDIRPQDSDTLHMMGIGAFQSNDIESAVDLLGRAVEISPDRADFKNDFGNVLKYTGQTDRAIQNYKEAIKIRPNYAIAFNNLGATMNDISKHHDAEQYLLRAIELKPDYAEAYYNCGITYKELGEIGKAIENYNHAISYSYPKAYINLGVALMDIGNEVDAIKYFKQAIKILPNSTDAYNNLGNTLSNQGNPKKAVICYKKCLEINPNLHKARSNLLLTLHYTDTASPEEIFLEHKKWSDIHELPIQTRHPHNNDRAHDKKLRIGYISPDFRSHPVAHFIEPILASHDRTSFDVYCYCDVNSADHVTQRIKALPVIWRDICRMSDNAATDLILKDRIDILIDLAGHTANNRLMVFAQKPAPVQATYLGYPDTTGLISMDYRIVDFFTDPPGTTEHIHTEELSRMPHGFLCYSPPGNTPEPCPVPALESGHITFGCFNKRSKITDEAINTWSAILSSVPDSRLFLKFKNFLCHEEKSIIIELFSKNNISPGRIDILKPIKSLPEHIGMYSIIDIALDTFPYNGTTTTCEALWMGVPVITLTGRTHASRVGTSILKNIGLDDLIAGSNSDYINKALLLAKDIERLKYLRSSLRDIVRESPLMDKKTFTIHLENLYRKMWHKKTIRRDNEH